MYRNFNDKFFWIYKLEMYNYCIEQELKYRGLVLFGIYIYFCLSYG